jgi:uncharacterized protein (DUF1778 family)
MDKAKRANPNIAEEPWYQREFLGQWVADDRRRVYNYNDFNLTSVIPAAKDIILGIDFGYNDPTAFTLCFSTGHELYYVDAKEQTEMLLQNHIEIMTTYMNEFPDIYLVCDPGGTSKALIEELRRNHDIPLIPAVKVDKLGKIASWNKDASLGIIKIIDSESNLFRKKTDNLVWRTVGGNVKMTPDDHVNDAGLYAYNFWKQNLYTPKEEEVEKLTPQQAKELKIQKYMDKLSQPPKKPLGFKRSY